MADVFCKILICVTGGTDNHLFLVDVTKVVLKMGKGNLLMKSIP